MSNNDNASDGTLATSRDLERENGVLFAELAEAKHNLIVIKEALSRSEQERMQLNKEKWDLYRENDRLEKSRNDESSALRGVMLHRIREQSEQMSKLLTVVCFDSSRREALSIRDGLLGDPGLMTGPFEVGTRATCRWIDTRMKRSDEILRVRGISVRPALSVDTIVERARWEAVCSSVAEENTGHKATVAMILDRARQTEG